MNIVLDEWIYHVLVGQRTPREQIEANIFLNKILLNDDVIVVLRNSSLHAKLLTLPSAAWVDAQTTGSILFFQNAFMTNADKLHIVDESTVTALPKRLKVTPRKDVYLVQTQLSLPDSVIVTTDQRLIEAISRKRDVKIEHRDSFLADYS